MSENGKGDVKKAFRILKMAQIQPVCACFVPAKVNKNEKYIDGPSVFQENSF